MSTQQKQRTKPLVKVPGVTIRIDGPKQRLRRARRSGQITARQQRKIIKAHRRIAAQCAVHMAETP